MSPVGRVGINIAIQDAAAAVNVLAGGISLKSKQLTEVIAKLILGPESEYHFRCRYRRLSGLPASASSRMLRRPLNYQL
jgi:hypothetical protein